VIEGGCFCRRIRYVIDEGTYTAANCHCTMCRRIHAAPYVTWLVVPTGRFRYTGELPARLVSSPGGSRDYCPSCGSHITCANVSHPDRVDVATGSLDSPQAFEPTIDVFTDTRLPWAAEQLDACSRQ
jgi:hypothetical protein